MPPAVRTPVGDAPVIPLVLLGTGMYLAWFGVHYWKSDVKFPTDPVKAVLQGKGLPAATQTLSPDEQAVETSAKQIAAAEGQLAGQQGVTPGTGTAPSSSAVGQAVVSGAAPNQGIGKLLAASYGWSTGTEWDDLVSLWDRESGWDNTIWNGGSHAATLPAGSSGAYGIAQSLPYTKYPKAGWPPGYGGSADPHAQISWGLAYIKSTYGSPSAAWAHETSAGWY
jgi:hypothetical protein